MEASWHQSYVELNHRGSQQLGHITVYSLPTPTWERHHMAGCRGQGNVFNSFYTSRAYIYVPLS